MARVIPVILSGGTGTRLWPVSRQSFPKQFLRIAGDRTMLQAAALRGRGSLFGPLTVIANVEHRFAIAEQLRAIGIEDARIILEPFGRNTAPAVAVAALAAAEADPDALILVMPSDHVIADAAAFHAAVAAGAEAAAGGAMVLFGIPPTRPETGYGYIRSGAPLPGHPGILAVEAFIEKPDGPKAQAYLAAGYLWNSGIFLLPVRGVIEALGAFAPVVLDAARAALAGARNDLDFTRLDAEAFAASPSISIDYAVMEKTPRAAVLPGDFGWSDAGTWSSLWEIAAHDDDGNVVVGEGVALNTRNSYLRSEGPLVATVGVENLVVVATGDAVLVAARSADQDVSKLVELLKQNGTRAATLSPWVHRPWGFYQSLHAGERFQVKQITVNPGARLSLQKHRHRAEHWVVVNGTARVTRDDEILTVRENESVFLPLGCVHRLENPGETPLNLIEVQSGSYLGEDDIIRIEDDFQR
ncbi:MAG: mannose-1-phosphate guanylyltransferase/mannose-6-phosphate isomerase [Bauldia sp.]|nr:mannose-1-phosphate guanylyltransferase/mannose-6-phosphate isomerase [Bauldia sp.]